MSRKTILFISPVINIASPTGGEASRLNHLSKELASRGWEVVCLVPSAGPQTPEWISRTYTYKQWRFTFLTDLNPWFIRSLQTVLREEDVDVIHGSKGICAARVLAGRRYDIKLSYAAQNVEADHAREFVNPTLPRYKKLLGPVLIPHIERLTVACSDFLTVVSEPDRDVFRSRYDVREGAIEVVPTGTTPVDVRELTDPASVRDRFNLNGEVIIVFHGSYSHDPNQEAVHFIARSLAPAMRAVDNELEFVLCGKGMPEFEDPAIQTLGFVDDLFSVLNMADLAVVPVGHGGGTNTKVFDYLSVGLPIVATRHALRGIDLTPGTHAVVVDGLDNQFVKATEELIQDDDRRSRMETEINSWANKRTWSASGELLDRAYSQLIQFE